jgi:hypothetical protein
MTREEIMLIAKEAGVRLASYSDTVDQRNVYPHELERFAKLFGAAEREACAKVCEETAASWTQHLYNSGCMDCAAAIRART